jgi:hypothetical protein
VTLSLEDLNKLTADYYYRNPDCILAALACAAEHDDKEMWDGILAECKSRNIDVEKLISDDIARHERLWGKINRSTSFSGGKELRSPLIPK